MKKDKRNLNLKKNNNKQKVEFGTMGSMQEQAKTQKNKNQNAVNQGQGNSQQYMNEFGQGTNTFAEQAYNAYSQSAKASTDAAKKQYKNVQNESEFAQGTGNIGQAMSKEAKLNSQEIAKKYKKNSNIPNQGGK